MAKDKQSGAMQRLATEKQCCAGNSTEQQRKRPERQGGAGLRTAAEEQGSAMRSSEQQRQCNAKLRLAKAKQKGGRDMKKRKHNYTGKCDANGDTIILIFAVIAVFVMFFAAYRALLKSHKHLIPPPDDERIVREAEPIAATPGEYFFTFEPGTQTHAETRGTTPGKIGKQLSRVTVSSAAPTATATSIEPPGDEVYVLAQMLTGECYAGETLDMTRAAWTAINRAESPQFPDDIIGVITAPGQFNGWRPSTTPSDEALQIAHDILMDWHNGDYHTRLDSCGDKIYLYFTASGGRTNNFRESF